MKKILIASSLILLLAAGCNKNNQAAQNTTNTNTNQTTNTTTSNGKTFAMSEVQTANSASKCWSVISGKVYDLTTWINQHPGGPEAILSLCGKDGTSAFDNQHGNQRRPADELSGFYIGDLK